MDLNANPCGNALLKVAGEELANECQKIGSLQAGNMASTGPAKLNCKRVYHVRSSYWDKGEGALVIVIANLCFCLYYNSFKIIQIYFSSSDSRFANSKMSRSDGKRQLKIYRLPRHRDRKFELSASTSCESFFSRSDTLPH